MEMTCEFVEDDYTSRRLQECNTVEDTPVLQTPCVTSLGHIDGRIEHKIVLNAIPSATESPLSSVPFESPTESRKRNVGGCVVPKKPPGSLVQAAEKRKVLLVANRYSPNAHALIQHSGKIARAVPRQPDLSVMTESGNVENDQRALMPDPTAVQNSVTSTADTSAHADGGVRSNISVILLNSAQRPKVAGSNATSLAEATRPQDVSRMVLKMLRKQNIHLPRLSNKDSTTAAMCSENEQRRKIPVGLPGATDSTAKLRNTLQLYHSRNAELERKLKAEQAKVRSLLAEVKSLKSTVKQLSSDISRPPLVSPLE